MYRYSDFYHIVDQTLIYLFIYLNIYLNIYSKIEYSSDKKIQIKTFDQKKEQKKFDLRVSFLPAQVQQLY